MTRKSISTNAAVVACDVCGRTLLRGENADVFLHGGSRRMVCELCTARAVHEGWIREGLDDVEARSRDHRGRSRSLLGRLRSRRDERRGDELAIAPDAPDSAPVAEPSYVEVVPAEPPPLPVEQAPSVHHEAAPPAPQPAEPALYEQRSVRSVPTNAELKVQRALELFNGSAHPRTVAGVARSLGAPIVSARPSATEGSVVTIVVAWELSWYRFEVDLGNEEAGVRVVAQGTELAELDPADHTPNAAADDAGQLHPAASLA
ncbi:hypothetical protein [Conexibacter sp. SYSU D00693]|uniref:hypothetical protein n=1 Tax=Conexibacter sp. SYSU D00693 TaxID=2812560 RepID=UPI00196BA5EA|nr:hypothetical protein [Conexibacter sp. SYSU D00693]